MRDLDIGIFDVGALSEGGSVGVGLQLYEGDHVFSCFSEVVVRGNILKWCAVWEPVDRDSISGAFKFRYETVEASLVVHG